MHIAETVRDGDRFVESMRYVRRYFGDARFQDGPPDGRARALEVLLSAEDYDAELAERYGWINRALPASTLSDFVRSLAQRIASFPAAGQVAIKDRINAITLAPTDDFRRDSDLFGEQVHTAETNA